MARFRPLRIVSSPSTRRRAIAIKSVQAKSPPVVSSRTPGVFVAITFVLCAGGHIDVGRNQPETVAAMRNFGAAARSSSSTFSVSKQTSLLPCRPHVATIRHTRNLFARLSRNRLQSAYLRSHGPQGNNSRVDKIFGLLTRHLVQNCCKETNIHPKLYWHGLRGRLLSIIRMIRRHRDVR